MSRDQRGNRTQEVVGSIPTSSTKFHQPLMTQLDFGFRKLFSGVRVSFPMPRPVQAGKVRRFVQCRLTRMKIRRMKIRR